MPKRVLIGTIVSDKGDKTVVVRVDRRVKHPLYGKIIRRSKKYHAHDEANAYAVGEIVRLEECPPVSKLKSWKVIDRIGSAKAAAVEISDPDEALSPEVDTTNADNPAKASKGAKASNKAKAEDVAEADA